MVCKEIADHQSFLENAYQKGERGEGKKTQIDDTLVPYHSSGQRFGFGPWPIIAKDLKKNS